MSTDSVPQPISLLIPVKNAEAWLPRTLKGILLNVEPVDEIVIVDNDSSDETIKILRRELRDYNVKYLKNSGGLADALNLGITKCENLWVARFDADDFYPRNRLAEQRKALGEAKGVAAIFSDYRILGDGVKFLGYIPTAITPLATEISLRKSQRTPHSSALFHKDSVLSVGGYSQEEFPAEDLGLWLRLTQKYSLVGIPINGLDYNLHSTSITGKKYRESKRITRILNERHVLSIEKLVHAIENLEQTIGLYSAFEYFPERSLLHLLEILEQPSFQSLAWRYKQIVLLKILNQNMSLNNWKSNINLFRFKIMRKNYRNLAR